MLIGLVSLSVAKADGMIMPPPNYYVHETSQKAVIIQEGEIETMVLQVSFRGNAKDFAWIVPTPSKPEIEESSDNLFSSLEELTTENYHILESAPMELGMGSIKDTAKVSVIETKRVGIFKIDVLAANDAEALARWLSDHQYQFPEKQAYILENYIDNDWYFTAIKVDAGLVEEDIISERLKTGHATPIKFVFKSEKIVYPLEISSVGINEIQKNNEDRKFYPPYDYFSDKMPIMLYVFSNHKVQAPGFFIDYASWLKRARIEQLAQDSQGNPWIKIKSRKLFLTKLSANKSSAEMTEDVYLANANDNKPVGVEYTVWWLALAVFFGALLLTIISPFGFLFIIGAIIYRFAVDPTRKAIAVALEFFSIILSLVIFGGGIAWVYVTNRQFSGGEGSSYVIFAVLGLLIALILMLGRRILEIRRNKPH